MNKHATSPEKSYVYATWRNLMQPDVDEKLGVAQPDVTMWSRVLQMPQKPQTATDVSYATYATYAIIATIATDLK